MNRIIAGLFSLLILLAAAGAQQKPSAPSAKTQNDATPNLPSEETVNGFMQQMFGYDSTLTWKVQDIKPSKAQGLAEVTVVLNGPQGPQSNKLYVTEDGKYAVTGDILPFGAKPFEADRKTLEKGINGPSRGPANAPVTIVEFSDLQCPHCKAAQPDLDKLLTEEPNVRLVFQNFPLPMHDWAMKAASYADCVARSSNDEAWKFIQGVYDVQTDITASNADEKLNAIADAAGAKSSAIASCAANPETTSRIQHSLDLGQSLDVNSTPTIFINGRRVSGLGTLPHDVLKKLVEFAAKP
jgi:protein-disulfide isomerase